jgi:hypothetical protein
MEAATMSHPRPEFVSPLPDEYLYVGLAVDPPTRVPVVRRSARRDQVLDRCRALVREVQRIEGIADATLFETVLIPPVPGVPRFDITLLVRASTTEVLTHVRRADLWSQLEPDLVMTARNTRRIGDTQPTRSATFLFNHFTAPDTATAVAAWEDLAGWYTAKTGVDNSTLLQPTGASPYAFINYVRLPGSGAHFLLDQISRPSFHSYVRRTLDNNGMTALPLLCRPA